MRHLRDLGSGGHTLGCWATRAVCYLVLRLSNVAARRGARVIVRRSYGRRRWAHPLVSFTKFQTTAKTTAAASPQVYAASLTRPAPVRRKGMEKNPDTS